MIQWDAFNRLYDIILVSFFPSRSSCRALDLMISLIAFIQWYLAIVFFFVVNIFGDLSFQCVGKTTFWVHLLCFPKDFLVLFFRINRKRSPRTNDKGNENLTWMLNERLFVTHVPPNIFFVFAPNQWSFCFFSLLLCKKTFFAIKSFFRMAIIISLVIQYIQVM